MGELDEQYDCFLSHNSQDKAAVRVLARQLRDRGLRIWLDEDELRPGVPWQELLELGIKQSRSALVLIGADGLGPWEEKEMRAVLNLAVKDQRPVIPVLLPDTLAAPELPLFLQDLSWVDLRANAESGELSGLQRLIWGITGRKPVADGESRCPDSGIETLSQELDALLEQEEELIAADQDAKEIRFQILEKRRQIRQGNQLRPGDFLAGRRYKLIEVIGRGGFATVFKAFDKTLRRLVAIKVLHGQLADEKSRVERFERGARLMARLTHPNIVQVLDPGGEDDGHHFFVMEYLQGGDLHRAILAGQMDSERALEIILGVGEALAFAHAQDVIHRDVKPHNILLDERGRPKLSDFDLVRAGDTTGGTHTGALGSFGYAAPEAMHKPQDADARADVYGLGMTAIFALHGAELNPHQMFRDPDGLVSSLDVARPVKRALLMAIHWEREQRYSDIEGFLAAITEIEPEPPGNASVTDERKLDLGVTLTRDQIDRLLERGMALGVDGEQLNEDEVWEFVERTRQAGLVAPAAHNPRESAQAQGLTPFRDPLKDGSQGPRMIALPGGIFRMGSPEGLGSFDERPAHRVKVTGFALGQYPLTVGDFRRFVEASGYRTEAEQGGGASVWTGKQWTMRSDASWRQPYLAQDDTHPVVCVSWNDAQAYCRWLSEQTGQRYQLPSEAQWEFACRAGGDSAYCFGAEEVRLGDYGWYGKNSGKNTHPVGQKAANAWGLHDLHGNVWEWCRDGFRDYSKATVEDPIGPEAAGGHRVIRGGSWYEHAQYVRCASRLWNEPGLRNVYLGFRPARVQG